MPLRDEPSARRGVEAPTAPAPSRASARPATLPGHGRHAQDRIVDELPEPSGRHRPGRPASGPAAHPAATVNDLPGKEVEPLPSRRRRSARPPRPRSRRRVSLTVTVAALGIGLVIGPDLVGRVLPGGTSGTGVPVDNPVLGLVYQDLTAPQGTGCPGGYLLAAATGRRQGGTGAVCTFGPEPAPTGYTVSSDVDPVAGVAATPAVPVRDGTNRLSDRALLREVALGPVPVTGPALAADQPVDDSYTSAGSAAPACQGDGRRGQRVQVLYVSQAGAASRLARYAASIRRWSGGVDAMVAASADGARRVRYVTTADCRIEVAGVELPAGGLSSLTATVRLLRQRGFDRTDRKYLVFADSNVYCGIATAAADSRAGAANRNNTGPSYARVDAGCWGVPVAARELLRTLGAGQRDAGDAGRCDSGDLLCPSVPAADSDCAGAVLDCGNDDYFDVSPAKGSYLATHWNTARSAFLISGQPVDVQEPPAAEPAPAPRPAPSSPAPGPTPSPDLPPPPPGPAPTPTGTPLPVPSAGAAVAPGASTAAGPTAAPAIAAPGRPLRITPLSASALRLAWPAAARPTRFSVRVDGRVIGSTINPAVRLIGLQPDRRYAIAVLTGQDLYTDPTTTRTGAAPAPGPSTRFVNALTGAALTIADGRLAVGAPAVLAPADSAPAPLWKLRPSPGGTFSLTSAATGRCLVPRGGPVVGAPLVQAVCTDTDPGQRWKLTPGAAGSRLQLAGSDLALGVSRLHFGEQHLIVLQRAGAGRSQSWLATD